MIQLEKVLKNDRLMRALTGLNGQEFTKLVPDFEKQWLGFRQKRYDGNIHRERKPGGGRKGFVKTTSEKLFFVLLHKCYPTYDVLSFFYGCNRSNACRRQQKLSRVLEATLKRKLVLPKRQLRNIEELFKAFPETKEVGTERPIQRPQIMRTGFALCGLWNYHFTMVATPEFGEVCLF